MLQLLDKNPGVVELQLLHCIFHASYELGEDVETTLSVLPVYETSRSGLLPSALQPGYVNNPWAESGRICAST